MSPQRCGIHSIYKQAKNADTSKAAARDPVTFSDPLRTVFDVANADVVAAPAAMLPRAVALEVAAAST